MCVCCIEKVHDISMELKRLGKETQGTISCPTIMAQCIQLSVVTIITNVVP